MDTSDFTTPYNETNADAAKRLYTSATQKYNLKDYAEAVRLYEQAWQKDPYVGTFHNLALCYYHGWGTAKNAMRCHDLTFHAARMNDAQSMYNLASFYSSGFGCEANPKNARYWLEQAANKGYIPARYTLAVKQHAEAQANPPLLHFCYRNLKAAADNGHEKAQRLMAEWFGPMTEEEWQGMTTIDMFNRGCNWTNGTNGYNQNYVLALRCYYAAASRDYDGAWCNIGWILAEQDRMSEANEAYLKAANLGNKIAMVNLANNLFYGRGWAKDEAGARQFLLMAKSHGYEGIDEIMAGYFPEDEVARQAEGMTPYQMVRRGWTFMKGRDGEARNLRVAALWFDRAARNGYDDAWVYRGRALTLQGLHDQAFAAYREGADQGNIDCMGILGRCYAKGLGCEQDKGRAMDWWDKAYHRFHPRAGKMMTKLNPVAARKRMAQYMIDNMKMCIDLDFRFDDVNVRKLADQLIDHEEYDTARTLLRRCVSTIANNVGGSDLYEDVLVQLAWVYFMDGKGDDDYNAPYYNTRAAHDIAILISSNYRGSDRGKAEFWLANIFDECFANYEDYEIGELEEHFSQDWYNRRAYHYFAIAAEHGYYYAMFRQAVALIYGLPVAEDYDKAYELLCRCQEYQPRALALLGLMHFDPKYGRQDYQQAREYYEDMVEELDIEGNGSLTVRTSMACVNLADIYIGLNSYAYDRKAQQLLEIVRNYRGYPHADADALYGYMIVQGRCDNGRYSYDDGVEMMRRAYRQHDDRAAKLLRKCGL